MYIFKDLTLCLLLLKLAVSNGEMSDGISVVGFEEPAPVNRDVRESESSSTPYAQESDRRKSNNMAESTLKSSSEPESDSEEDRDVRNGNTPVPIPTENQKNSKKESDSDRQPELEGKQNDNGAGLARAENVQHSKAPESNPEDRTVKGRVPDTNQEMKTEGTDLENRNRAQPESTKVDTRMTSSSNTNTNSGNRHRDLKTSDENVPNNDKIPLPQNNQTDSSPSTITATDPSISQSNNMGGNGTVGTELDPQRTEKNLRVNGTDNQHSSAAAAPIRFDETEVRQNPNKENKDDAEPVLNNESINIPQTTSAPSISQSKSNDEVPTQTAQPPSPATENSWAESPSRDPKSPPQYTTTIFQAANSTNEFENRTEENQFVKDNHDGHIVVTDRTLVSRPTAEETDLNLNASAKTPPASNYSLFTKNTPTTDSKDDLKSSNILTPNDTVSSTTPTEVITIDSNKTTSNTSMEKNENHAPSEDSQSTTISTGNSNSTVWRNGTGVPPVNSTENNTGPIGTIKEFFRDLKAHTVLCIISIMLFLLAVTVIVSMVILVYYLFKLCVLGLVRLCKRMGVCTKRKKSLGTIPEGSLFPRCDVNVAPYVQNAGFRHSTNAVDSEMY